MMETGDAQKRPYERVGLEMPLSEFTLDLSPTRPTGCTRATPEIWRRGGAERVTSAA
jgi:hypothetical protein